MKIERLVECVSQLLFEHNCVIIPGFGGFITNFKSAGFEENRNLLCPTRKRVAFNINLDQNDGLLANHWSKIYSMSYHDACLEIDSFVDHIKSQLGINRPFEFSNLGTFYLNAEQNLIFLPLPNLNFNLESFGLEPLKIKALLHKPVGVKIKKVVLPEIKETKQENSTIEIQETVVRRLFPYKQIAAIFILFVAVIGFMNYDEISKLYTSKSTTAPEQTASLFIPDSNQTSVKELNTEETSLSEMTEVPDEITITEPENINSIQVFEIDRNVFVVAFGKFKNEAKAQLELNKIREFYTGSQIIKSKDSTYQIQVESFYNDTTADAFHVILKQMGYPDVVVLKLTTETFTTFN